MKNILALALSVIFLSACNTSSSSSNSSVDATIQETNSLKKSFYVEEEFEYLLDLNLAENPSEFYEKMPSNTKSIGESNTIKYLLDAKFYHQVNFYISEKNAYQIDALIDFSLDSKSGETLYFNVRKYLLDKFDTLEPDSDVLNVNENIYYATWSTDFVEGGFTEYSIRFIGNTFEYNITLVGY